MSDCRAFLRKVCVFVVTVILDSTNAGASPPTAPPTDGLRFEVAVPAGPRGQQTPPKLSGRLMVVLGKPGFHEPRLSIGQTGQSQPPVLGGDVFDLAPGGVALLDGKSAIYPIASLSELKPGRYAVQALLHTNPDLNYPNAPGDLYSPVVDIELDPTAATRVRLELTEAVPAETLPADSEFIKYLKIPSRLLSDFHGRPIYLRAGVILPTRLRARAGPALPARGPYRRLRRALQRRR